MRPRSLRQTQRLLTLAAIALLASAAARAGTNAWTGGHPGEAGQAGAIAVAADPHDAAVAYAVFASGLYKTTDGGRTWTKTGSFESIYAVYVHPASSATVYVSVSRADGTVGNVFKSADAGLTWSRTSIGDHFDLLDHVLAFAGSPTDASALYAGTSYGIFYRTSDGGASWAPSPQGLLQSITALVLGPGTPQKIFAGTEADFEYCGFGAACTGRVAASDNDGATFADTTLNKGDVMALAVDPASPSTIYAGLSAHLPPPAALRGVYRSDDSGVTWSPAGAGLPGDANVLSMTIDPSNPTTIYAGSESGAYRSRDGGATWEPLGRQLAGAHFWSLAVSGRLAYAATDSGVFTLDDRSGPIDVASAAAGGSRVLSWDGDRLTLRGLDASGTWTSGPPAGPYAGWAAVALAEGRDGLTRVLWQSGDGRVALGTGASGTESVVRLDAVQGFTAADVSVSDDGSAWLLWSGADGRMFLSRVDGSGAQTFGSEYGAYPGWSAIAAAGSGDGVWVLWRSMDGRASVSRHGVNGVMNLVQRFDAKTGAAAEDIAVGADGLARILWTAADGGAQIWTVSADGALTSGQSLANPGSRALRLSAGADGATRLLWNGDGGAGSVWLLNSDNTERSRHDTPAAP